jgi:hypothetical protein
VAQLGARLDGIEEVVGSNPIGSTKSEVDFSGLSAAKVSSSCLSAASVCVGWSSRSGEFEAGHSALVGQCDNDPRQILLHDPHVS